MYSNLDIQDLQDRIAELDEDNPTLDATERLVALATIASEINPELAIDAELFA
jgi:hypothetical protein